MVLCCRVVVIIQASILVTCPVVLVGTCLLHKRACGFASEAVQHEARKRAFNRRTHWPAMPPFKDEQIIVCSA